MESSNSTDSTYSRKLRSSSGFIFKKISEKDIEDIDDVEKVADEEDNINISDVEVNSIVDSVEDEYTINDEWVAATSTFNYLMKDPLLDWLKEHYHSLKKKHKTYRHIINKCVEDGKSTYNFSNYMQEQGIVFEKKVMKLIIKKFGKERIMEIRGETDPRNPDKVMETIEAMKKGIPIIHSGVLHNLDDKTFGIPDLIVRSDWINLLVDQGPLPKELEKIEAPNLETKFHYRIIDIKFTGLCLRADGMHLLNSGSFPAYKAQLLIYNQALGIIQGYTPDQVYILGRRWKYSTCGDVYIGESCFNKLGVIDYSYVDSDFKEVTKNAVEWIREVRSDKARKWDIFNFPLKREELYPNLKNHVDFPWRAIKEKIAKHTKELTSLWLVGPKNRSQALEKGICRWTDKRLTPQMLGINGEKSSKILKAIIDINQSKNLKIQPDLIKNNIGYWKNRDHIEMFVDFESTNGSVSPVKKLPMAKSETIIFMIGVGFENPETGKWVYKHFTSNRLTMEEEKKICQEFVDFIKEMSEKYNVRKPKLFHWSGAEELMWDGAIKRHNPDSNGWKSHRLWWWTDMLKVFKGEPIVVNGCMSFSLKDVARAMNKHGFIKTSWDKTSVCVDGQGAMIAAQKANIEARERGVALYDVPILNEILKYNEVDVKVLHEIVTYLRKNHTLQGKMTWPGKIKRKHVVIDEDDDNEDGNDKEIPLIKKRKN